MKAVVCERYGPPEVLKLKDVPKPIPKTNEILIKIKATAVNSGDVRIRGLIVSGFMRIVMRIVLGFTGPRKRILGIVLSGVVEAVGENVRRFKPGDEVFGSTGFALNTNAEYIAHPENGVIAFKPKKASFEQAAAIPFGGGTAIYFLEKAGIGTKPAQKVLIYGSSGAVGTAAVQIAKHFGAEVTAVCSEDGVKLAKSLGADHIIVYTKEDFAKSGEQYDIIFEAVAKKSKKEFTSLLVPGGKFVTVGGLDVAAERRDQLELLSKLYDNGEYKAVIDRTYPLKDIVEAHRYVEQGKKKGNVVITVS
jgi:NADPH:quinone reductase-like Zn-dependent oxidoreductase